MSSPSFKAIVFDAYGTLFDVRSVEATCTRLTPHGEAFAALWRAKQLEYTWLRTLMGAYVPFEQVTAEALDYALRRLALQMVRDGEGSERVGRVHVHGGDPDAVERAARGSTPEQGPRS